MVQNKIALFDIDDTIYKGGVIFPLLDQEQKDNFIKKKYVAKINDNFVLYKKGVLDYEEVAREAVELWAEGLKNQKISEVAEHAKQFIMNDLSSFYQFLKPLIVLLKPTHNLYIVTNEPQFVSQPISNFFSFTDYSSTEFELLNGKLTGKVSYYNSSKHDKKKSIEKIFERYNKKGSLAFGDSLGDVGMFEEVEYPICINASSKLLSIAKEKKWRVVTESNILEEVSKLV